MKLKTLCKQQYSLWSQQQQKSNKGPPMGLPWWLRLHAPNAEGLDSIPGERTRFRVLQPNKFLLKRHLVQPCPQLGMEPAPPALEAQSQLLACQESPQSYSLMWAEIWLLPAPWASVCFLVPSIWDAFILTNPVRLSSSKSSICLQPLDSLPPR